MKYYIIAGEASGDLHGANLMRAIQEQDSHAEFSFWGGDAMQQIGGVPRRHIRDLAIMGFVEVVQHLPTVLGNIQFCKKDILDYSPDIVVGIDYPGFNLKIEEWAHKKGFKTVHYISPNLWAWKQGRIKKMRRSLDSLCYILPFEQHFFATHNMPQATYVGHPLLDAIAQSHIERIGDAGKPIIAMLPGSRRQELANSLPTMTALARRHPEYQFVIGGMSLLSPDLYIRHIAGCDNISIVFDQTYSLLASAYAALVCSGTATLETALFNVPQVVCYKANPISIAIARRLVGQRIHYISLVNLIADRPIVTELLQNDFNLERLEQEFALITANSANRERIEQEYAQMRQLLGDAGANQKAASTIISLIK